MLTVLPKYAQIQIQAAAVKHQVQASLRARNSYTSDKF